MTRSMTLLGDHEERERRPAPTALLLVLAAGIVTTLILLGGFGSAAAQTDDTADTADSDTADSTESTDTADAEGDAAEPAADDELLRTGAAVYTQVCQSCHQPGGVGLPGSYPPLLDNPAVDDTAYVMDVINNGLQGELVVDGETYNGVMPSFSTLPEADVEALIAYIQSGFQAPSTPAPDVSSGPVAGTELPFLADIGWQIAFLIAALVFLLVVGPRLAGRIDRLNTPWFDAWLKTATIVVATVLAVAYIPNWVLQTSVVADLDRPLQDLIGVTVWGLGLTLCLGGLWFAHRDRRV